MTLSYASADIPVREDLVREHRHAWARLASPGTWWTGAERVALAAEVRHARSCRLCRERKEALSSYGVPGEHDTITDLPAHVVEAVHRITTDPGRLTEAWVQGLQSEGLSDVHYVELIAVVVTALAIDSVATGIGAELPELPEPKPGEPTCVRPEQAVLEDAWVPMVSRGQDTGPLEGLFGEGFVPNVVRALSLVPEETRGKKRLSGVQYIPYMDVANPQKGNDVRAISRSQIESVAARVSIFNECFY